MQRKVVYALALMLLTTGLTMFALGTHAVKATTLVGDVNGDGKVDIRDLYIMAKAYGSHGPPDASPNWNPDCDLNADNVVDAKDVFLLLQHFGQTV